MERRIEVLDPTNLYTQEVIVFDTQVEAVDLKYPITFGRDINGTPYIDHGNHRAAKAYKYGLELKGEQIATANFDVTKDEYFHPASELKIIK